MGIKKVKIFESLQFSKLTWLVALLFYALPQLNAQEALQIQKSSTVQIIEGKEYYLHHVEQGQTLWAITRAYNCTEEQIKNSNPEYDGILKIGQILRIPKEIVPPRKTQKQSGDATQIHIVQRGETLFSIARHYLVNVDTLISYNKLKDVGLKPGQELRVPPSSTMTVPAKQTENVGLKEKAQPIAEKKDTSKSLTHTVLKGETLFSLARQYGVTVNEIISLNPETWSGLKEGMTLLLPDLTGKSTTGKSITETTLATNFKCNKVSSATYRVALMIPLFSNEAEKIIVKIDDVKPPSAFRSFNFIQFYEGVLLALEELEKQGVSVKFYVYDTYRSEDVVRNLLEKPDMAKMDMIIGPFYSNAVELVAAFSQKNNIVHINPFSNQNLKTCESKYHIKLQASVKNQIQALIDYACDSLGNPNIVVVHNNVEDEQEFLKNTRLHIGEILRSKGQDASCFKEVHYREAGFAGLREALHRERNNLIITLIQGEAFVASYLTTLNKIRDDYKIFLVVNPNWLAYNNIDLNHLVNLNGIGYSSYFINYEDTATNRFIQLFREKYKTEPDPYAFQGFDISYFFITSLHSYGKNFVNCLNWIEIPILHTHYSFERKTAESSSENTTVNIFLYSNYKLVLKYRR